MSPTGVISRISCAVLVTILPLNALAQTPSTSQKPAAERTSSDDDDLPVSLERIREGLGREPRLELKNGVPHYYVDIYGKFPRFEEFLEGFDLKHGPVPGAGLTHQEFLAMVTPKDLSSTNVTPALDTLVVRLKTLLGKWIASRVAESISEAARERELQRIRKEIREVLEQIEKNKNQQ